MNFLFGDPIVYDADGSVKFCRPFIYSDDPWRPVIYVAIAPPFSLAHEMQPEPRVYKPDDVAYYLGIGPDRYPPIEQKFKKAIYRHVSTNHVNISEYKLIGVE